MFHPLKDDELDEETKSFLISTAEDAILSSPKGSTSSKSPENPVESSKSATSAPAQAKKIVLKRKLLPSVSLTESESSKTDPETKVLKLSNDGITAESAAESSNGNNDGNMVKLSELTMKGILMILNCFHQIDLKMSIASSLNFSFLIFYEFFFQIERLELRAKKFGAAPTGEAAKLARAERFGIATNATPEAKTDSKDSSLTITKTAPSVELLKKRYDN